MPKRRLRLLFVVNETYFFMSHRLGVARTMRRAGFEVHIAGPSDHVWAPENFSVDELRDAGFVYHDIPLSRRGMNPVEEIKTIWSIINLFKRVQPDIIHLLTVKPILYGGFAARILDVPAVVFAITGLGQIFVENSYSAKILRFLVAWVYQVVGKHPNCRMITQNSGDSKILLERNVVDRGKLVLIRGSGVDITKFKYTPEKDDVPMVILPARLIWEKGIEEFVGAARVLGKKRISARFVIVGGTNSSNPRAVPEKKLLEWQRNGDIEWWGRREDMPDVFAAAHIICLPTSYGEGVPKALIEAAASGRPIIASNIPGCREIVHDGQNGLLVPIGDKIALVNALTNLISNSELRKKMGHYGRQLVETEFAEELVSRSTIEVYREILAFEENGPQLDNLT